MAALQQRTFFVVSDGTGRTCQTVLKAALVQYPEEPIQLVIKPNVRTPEEAQAIVVEAAEADAVLFYTMVVPQLRRAIAQASKEHLVPCVDVLGPTLSAFHTLFGITSSTPGLLYQREKEHFDRLDAIDYTLNHDDGAGLRDLNRADVILVGVSRASKSSTCFYLAYQGIRAANVPLFADREPPIELQEVDPKRVIGLTMNVHRLQAIRQARVQSLGAVSLDQYDDRREVARELRAGNAIMAKYNWHSIDVSFKATEEVAREVVMRLRAVEQGLVE
ncbi:MAG TPA: kinase/pyrophosphorylase [Phycisphaeraceae bacterium]|nr:kinase/pyrophosphorylase [Phycisphaeraceae bacterium]